MKGGEPCGVPHELAAVDLGLDRVGGVVVGHVLVAVALLGAGVPSTELTACC